VQKNDEAPGVVTWKEKADQMKPVVGIPNIQIPNSGAFNKPGMPVNGVAGQNLNANQINVNGAMVGSNGAVINNAGVPGAVPGQPNTVAGVPAAQGQVSGGQQQLLDLLSRSKTPAANAGTAPGANPNNPLGRRRVVLPTPSAPAPPVVNQ
jgi:hypothetical protein